MASTTPNLHLKLLGTSLEDKQQNFESWRQDINGEGEGSNMRVLDTAYGQLIADVIEKVNRPSSDPQGTSGQVLSTNGDGTTRWVTPFMPTDELVEQVITDWMDAHPEATTSVEDGSISVRKLTSDIVALLNKVNPIETNVTALNEAVDGLTADKIDNGYVEDGVGYFTANGVIKFTMEGMGGGGGGGGGGGAGYYSRIVNGLPSTNLTVAAGQSTILPFTYIEYYGQEVQNQNGIMTVQYKLTTSQNWITYISNQQIPCNVQQTIDVGNLLTVDETTNVRITVSNGRQGGDAYTTALLYNISSVAMSISTSFNSAATYTGNFSLPYTCMGKQLNKTVYLYIDGDEYTHEDVGTSHNQPLQMSVEMVGNYGYGSHTAELWFVTDDGARSNVLRFPILYDNGTSNEPIIGALLQDSEIEDGETLYVNYTCYTPGQEQTDSMEITVYTLEDGSEDVYYNTTLSGISNNVTTPLPISTYPHEGTGYIRLESGNTVITLSFTVLPIQSEYDITPVTTGLVYEYRPTGYTNNSADKETYLYNLTDAVGNKRTITTTMTGFNWVTDGYKDGQSLTIAGAARMNIHLPILTTSFTNDEGQNVVLDAATGSTVTTSGRTIEFEFELDNVTNHNSVVFSCMDANGVGFRITPQVCYLLSDGQSLVLDSTGFIENEESIPCAYIKDEKRIRVSFVIQRKRYGAGNRFISYANIFINGEYANSYLYSDDAIYNGTATITIGSNDCVTKLYDVRIYNRDLSDSEVLRNRMNSAIDIRDRIRQNEYNDVLNSNGDVDYNKAKYKYPCLLFIGRLSNFKDDRQYNGVVLTKPDGLGGFNTEFSLLDRDANNRFVSSIKVQGTSSQRFMRKNFKVYLVKNDGDATKKVKYVLKGYDSQGNPLSIGESTLCYKADYMSTDHANTFNANIADTLFNDKQSGSLVQNCVWGFRCLLFNMSADNYIEGTAFEDYPEGVIEFAGDGCLNNDKGNSKSFGLETEGDDGNVTTQQKWEFTNNSNQLCTFKSDRLMEKVYNVDHTSYTIQARNGLESCYPDEGDLDDAGIDPEYKYIQLLYTWVCQRANFWDASTETGTTYTYTYTENGQTVTRTFDTERDYKKAIFKREFPMHFNLEHALVYYLFIEWVALCDNRAKNMFLSCKNVNAEHHVFKDGSSSIWDIVDMETGAVDESKIDWDHSTFGIWYTDLYDLDSCFGAENSGYIRIPYYADWNYILPRTGTNQFNGHDSRLWCMFEEAFADEIKARAKLITRSNTGSGTLNYAVLKQVHITDNAELVCPAIVNDDMEYKYEDAWTEGYWDYSVDSENPTWVQTSDYKYLQRGSRTEQKESFIYRRSMMLYSKYQTDQFLNDRIAFRCGTGLAQNETAITLSAIQSMWLGVTYIDGSSPIMSEKRAAGEYATLYAPDNLGRSDNVYIHGASNLTSISSLAAFKPYEIGLTNAGKLKTLLIGSDAPGYTNGNLTSLNTSACALLDTLNVQGCTGFSDAPIDLHDNTLIREVYAGGSTVPYFIFADGGILETLELGAPKRIILLNQGRLRNFSYEDLSGLTMLRVENTPNVGVLDILKSNIGALRLGIRLVGIDETIAGNDYSVLDMLVSDAARGKQLDADGTLVNNPNAFPVITGTIHTHYVGERTLSLLNEYYPNLTIDYTQTISQYAVTFMNSDGSPIVDRNGENYIQYIDSGSYAYDPIAAGEVDTPTRASTAQYTYAFSGWENLGGSVISNKTVTATYIPTLRSYTVTWHTLSGSTGEDIVYEKQTNVPYGSCVRCEQGYPQYAGMEANNIYYVCTGWDKSTSYITENMDVYPQWEIGSVPGSSTKTMQEMDIGTINAIAKAGFADTFWQPKEYTDIVLGRDYDYSNVESRVLVDTPIYFDGNSPAMVFNGASVDRPLIQLFSPDAPSFTLCVDYEITSDTGTLVSCYNENGNQGFALRRYGEYCNVLWGDQHVNVAYKYVRAVLTIRHEKGSNVLYIGHDGHFGAAESQFNYPASIANPGDNSAELARIRSIATETLSPLTFGGVGYTDGSDIPAMRATGWIHWAKIWYQDLGVYDTKAMYAFPRLKLRMNYTPIKYRLNDNSLETAHAGFMAENPLPYVRQIIPQAGAWSHRYDGWGAVPTRPWLNEQFFRALPIVWQNMIIPVRIKAISLENDAQQTKSYSDKVYLAAFAEVNSANLNTQIYTEETDDLHHTIPWFTANSDLGLTANATRIKFPGVTIDNDYNYIVTASEPTLYGAQYLIKSGKTIWINTGRSSQGYIYFDADFVTKHKHALGDLVSSEANIAAYGADSDGHEGGVWFPASHWWARSVSITSSTYHQIVQNTGVTNHQWIGYTGAIVPAFSI